MSGVARLISRNSPSMVASGPLALLLQHEFRECAHVGVTRVERRDVAQLLPARGAEAIGITQGDLLQGLEAVGGEAGADDVHPREALGGALYESFLRVGLEPFGGTEARLERQPPFPFLEA